MLPVTVTDGSGTTVEITSIDPIIPVDGDIAEIVFALGLGDRVIATDLSGTYPAAADAQFVQQFANDLADMVISSPA